MKRFDNFLWYHLRSISFQFDQLTNETWIRSRSICIKGNRDLDLLTDQVVFDVYDLILSFPSMLNIKIRCTKSSYDGYFVRYYDGISLKWFLVIVFMMLRCQEDVKSDARGLTVAKAFIFLHYLHFLVCWNNCFPVISEIKYNNNWLNVVMMRRWSWKS